MLFSSERVIYYARVAGWNPERLIQLFCEWFELEEGAQGDLDLEQFLLSKLTETQLERTIADALMGWPEGNSPSPGPAAGSG